MDVLFSCKVCDGAAFKSFASVLSFDSVVFVMTISKKKLIFSQCTTPDSSIINAELFKDELNDWVNTFESDVSFSFQSRDLSAATNVVKRSENVMLWMNNLDQICISIFHKAMSSENVIFLRCEQLPSPLVFKEDQEFEGKDPNVVEQCAMITVGCNTLTKQKCNIIRVIGRKSKLVLAGMSGDKIHSIIGFGPESEPSGVMVPPAMVIKNSLERKVRVVVKDPDEYVSFMTSNSVLSLISRACKITPNANVKIYILPDKPIKLVFPVFIYGRIVMYLVKK